MSRRTKKQKQNAKRNFTLSWEPSATKASSGNSVKRQKKSQPQGKKGQKSVANNTRKSAKDATQAQIKSDIVKSLIIASLILGVEVVIYLKSINGI